MPFTPGTPGVKSVQTVTGTITNSNSSASVTITSVNPAKSILYIGGQSSTSTLSTGGVQGSYEITAYISSATSVAIARGLSTGDSSKIFTIVEYY